MALPAPADPHSGPSVGSGGEVRHPSDRPSPSYYIILNSPLDLNELLQKIRHPDLEVRRVDRLAGQENGVGPAGGLAAPPPWVVESVRVRGQVAEDIATLKVELAIVTTSDDPIWVPIRLDDQKWLTGAREGTRELALRTAERTRWEVELAGRGGHRIEVGLRVPVRARPARQALSLAIPEAASTSLELDFSRHESDILIGANEDFGQSDLPDGKGTRLTARLTPRSQIDVSWTHEADAAEQSPPLLTAQGEIAIDIDSEQMRTSSSWVIRCVRGMSRTLEIQVDDQDEVTELRLDDQQTEAGIEGTRGGRLTIRLGDPLRPGASPRRLVMKTRRSSSKAAGRRIAFGGFPLTNAREQSGFIGVTQSSNLWISPATAQGLRQVEPRGLPLDLRARPSTSLAFEFLDQPFLLHLDVEAAPPLVRARSWTVFQVGADRARNETTIELQWVGGRLSEVGLGIGPGLQVVSVGPREVVDAVVDRAGSPGEAPADPGRAARERELKIRLKTPVRDQKTVTLQLEGSQRIPRDGPVKLGLFTPDGATAVHASFALAADRSLSLDLDDDSGRFTRSDDPSRPLPGPSPDRPGAAPRVEAGSPPLRLTSSDHSRSLPIRITRHRRSLAQETVLTAQVSRRSVDWLQQTTVTVRFGTVGSLEVRVPAAIADRWELLDREVLDREELGRGLDGTRRFRLSFDRPVLDKSTLRFRCRLPITPELDASAPREVALPRISLPDVPAGPTRVELTLGPEIVFRRSGPGWTRAASDAQAGRGGEAAVLPFTEAADTPGRPFVFQAMALEPVPLPPLVVPRLRIRTVQEFDEAIRSRAWYWVETHGPVFPFALPAGARWIAARVDGRVSEQVDYDPARSGYRLRFPADVGSRPALVELEYQVSSPDAGSRWQAPRLLDGALVLETLWEVRLPLDRTLVGVPRGWSDENEWYWDGNLWKRRPWRDGGALDRWMIGATAPGTVPDDFRQTSLDDSHRYLFSRAGEPAALGVWVVSRAWAVATCSGAALILGFFTIFSRIRLRTIWAVVAALALLAAVLLQPSVTLLGVQSAFIGVALTLLGMLIQALIERTKSPVIPGREPGSIAGTPLADSSRKQAASVGSDDSTAIRVRVPSTVDYAPSPLAGPPDEDEVRSSTLGRD
jgi:hypothetical protein